MSVYLLLILLGCCNTLVDAAAGSAALMTRGGLAFALLSLPGACLDEHSAAALAAGSVDTNVILSSTKQAFNVQLRPGTTSPTQCR
jgi:hypothetical protein